MSLRLTNTIGRIFDLSVAEWTCLAIALKELFFARIRHAVQPIARSLGEFEADLAKGDAGSSMTVELEPADIQRRAWAIAVVAARVPWRSDCLPQAMAANRWLRRDRARPDFFLGVAKEEAGTLRAHAWLKYNGINVTGGDALFDKCGRG